MTKTKTTIKQTNHQRSLAVAVAQDVLSHLDDLNIAQRTFLGPKEIDSEVTAADLIVNSKSTAGLATKLQSECRVCAIGAAVISACRLNLIGLGRIKEIAKAERAEDDENVMDSLPEILRPAFCDRQLILIENAFECGNGAYQYEEPCDNPLLPFEYEGIPNIKFDIEVAGGFGNRFEPGESKQKLRAIMENVVANNGEFTPY